MRLLSATSQSAGDAVRFWGCPDASISVVCVLGEFQLRPPFVRWYLICAWYNRARCASCVLSWLDVCTAAWLRSCRLGSCRVVGLRWCADIYCACVHLMVSCPGFGLPMHAQLLRLFVTALLAVSCLFVHSNHHVFWHCSLHKCPKVHI